MVRALAHYLPTVTRAQYQSLGGDEALEWAKNQLNFIGHEDPRPALGPNEIAVLGLPYGGPHGGKDSQGEYFSPMTDFMDELLPNPPVFYTHGTQNGFEPEPLGFVKERWYDRQCGWFKLQLDPTSSNYAQILEAHETGNLYASTGVVPASYDTDKATGHINSWLVGELSLVDRRTGYRPVNMYAVSKAEMDQVLFTDYYGDPVESEPDDSVESAKMKLAAAIKLYENGSDSGGVMVLLRQAFQALSALFTPQSEKPTESEETIEDQFHQLPMVKADVDYGGMDRNDLPDSDFALPDERKYPIVTQDDLDDAARLVGQYSGDKDQLRKNIIAIANRKKLNIPEAWKDGEKVMAETKCVPCEEAARLADELEAEIAARASQKCARCPEAMRLVKAWLDSGKISPMKAGTLVKAFRESDETLDEVIAEVEGSTARPGQKAERVTDTVPEGGFHIAGGQPMEPDPDKQVDRTWLAKQLANAKQVASPMKIGV